MLSLVCRPRQHPRPRASGCTAAVSSAPSVSPAHYLLLNSPERRVRATDARLRSLLAEGLHRSRTFASLVTALNRSDVIVYIESVVTCRRARRGT